MRMIGLKTGVSMRRAKLLVAAGGALLLAGCSWIPWFGEKKLAALPAVTDSAVSVRWSASVGSPKGFLLRPALGDRVVYAAAHAGKLTVLDEAGGRTVSSIDTKQRLTGAVGMQDDLIVAANDKGEVVAFDASGRTLWKSALEGELLAPPQVAQGAVIARTADGRLYALNRSDGKRRWVFTRTAPPLTLRSGAPVTIVRGVIYAGFPAGRVVAIELESGRPIWESAISLPRGTTELERIADVSGSPVVDGSRVCAAVYQGRTGCVETLNGNALWTRDISSADGVAIDEKNLYVVDTDSNVYALDKTSGSTVWKQERLTRRDLGTPVLVKGQVVVADRLGFVHTLSTATGDLTGRVATDGSRVTSLLLAGASQTVIAQTTKGGVYSLAVK